MRYATKDEEIKVITTMLKIRLKQQNKTATDEQIKQMALRIIRDADEKIGVLEP